MPNAVSTNAPFNDAGGTGVSVDFPTEGNFPLKLLSVRLHQEAEVHDVLEMTFKGRLSDTTTRLSTGLPVRLVFMSPGQRTEWVGYVHHVVPSNLNTLAQTTVLAVGASYVLKDSTQRVYRNVTADQVVSRIAAANGLTANTERHPRLYDTLSNTGQTEWQLLRRLAMQSGFALTVENTTVRFMSKDRLFNSSLSKGLYFKWGGIDTGVLAFSPKVAQGAPELAGAVVNRVVTGVHEGTGEPLKANYRAAARGKSHGTGVKGATK